MRKLCVIFLILIVALKTDAQSSKRTKEETVAYLDSIFAIQVPIDYHTSNEISEHHRKVKVAYSKLEGCKISFYLFVTTVEFIKPSTHSEHSKTMREIKTCDLTKVESIQKEEHGLILQAFNKEDIFTCVLGPLKSYYTNKISLPVNNQYKDTVMEALNDLRKECRALEPVKE